MPQVVAAAFGSIALGATAGASLGVSAAAFSVATAVGSAVGSALITGALVVGSQLLFRGQSASASAGMNEARGSIRQATPAQRVIYGNARIGGALFYHNDTDPPNLVWGLLLSRRPFRVVNVWVGNKLVQFDEDGESITFPYHDGSFSRLTASFREGHPDQDCDDLLQAFDESLDPATFRQRGHSTAVFRAKFGEDSEDFDRMWGLGTQIPNILLDGFGAPVFDPRVPSCDLYDPLTWVESNNATLVQTDWLRQPYGGRIDPGSLRLDEIADAANYDDELVGIPGGGFQKRYTIDGLVDLSQDPASVISTLLSANRGFVATDQGRLWVTSSRPQTPVLTITDSMLRGGFIYHETKRKDSILNTVRSRFVAPEREYSIIDGPVRIDPALVAADAQDLDETLGFNFTLTHERAQRLAEMALRQSRLQRAITTQLPVRRALGLRAGQVVRVQSDIVSRMDGLYQVESIGYADDYSVRPVTLSEYDGTLAGQFSIDDYLPFDVTEEST